jgi:hypothetical protein
MIRVLIEKAMARLSCPLYDGAAGAIVTSVA